MAFGRRKARGSLLQTAARTAVITGTAAATSNAVHGKAAARQQAAAAQTAPPVAQTAPPVAQTAPVAPPAPASTGVSLSTIEQLERLGALHTSGVLTDAEFQALKAQAIG